MKYLGYVILVVAVITSWSIFRYSTQDEYRRAQWRARITGQWRTAQFRTRQKFNDETLNHLLLQSGLSIRAPFYQYFRLLLTGLLLFVAVLKLLLSHQPLLLFLPILTWFGLGFQKPFPMYYGFLALQKQAAQQRNKSLYLLNRLLYQEILAFSHAPRSVYDMLDRQVSRVPNLQPFIHKCLMDWTLDPAVALQRLADDISTQQAQTFTQMLMQIEDGGPEVALDVFRNNQESFRTDRITAFQIRMGTRSLFATGLTLAGFGAVTYDLNVLIQVYTQNLMTFH